MECRYRRRILMLCIVMMTLWISICISDASDQQNAKNDIDTLLKRLSSSDRMEVVRAVENSAAGAFTASLEMKENVDFLLTPALLVQEAMSEGVIPTYPSE